MTGTADTGAPTPQAGTAVEPTPDQKAAELPVRPGVIIGMLVVSAFVMILNETVLSVALQHLAVDLDVPATSVQWLTSGFLLTLGVVIPTTGYLLQRFTPRRIFLLAMSLFTAGTAISGLAPGFEVLLAGRVVQAAGTALMIPLLMTTVMTLIPVERRGSMMGTISIVIAVAPAVGPTMGGFILTQLGWRWMFFSVLPLALLVLVLGFVLMRLSSETRRTPLDLPSVLLSFLAFGGIVYGFASLGEGGGGGHLVPPWVPLVVGVVTLVLFIARQRVLQRGDRALLDMRPFAFGQFRVAVILSALLFMSLLGAGAILLPLYLQTVLGLGADATGLAVLPGGLVLGLMGRPVGALFDRYGPRPLVIPGAIGLAVAMWLFALLGTGPLWAVVGAHIVLMVGLGLMMTPLLTSSLGVLPPHLYSHGSAILTTLQQVAGAAATAGLVTIATLFSASPSGTPDATGLRIGFVVAGILGVLAVVLSLFVRGGPAAGAAHGGGDTAGSGHEGSAPREAEQAGPEHAAAAHGAGDLEHLPREPVTDGPVAPETAAPRTVEHAGAASVPIGAPSGNGAVRVRGAVVASGPAARDGRDGPVPSAMVTLIDTDGRQQGRTRAVDGRFDLDAPYPGTWYVVVSSPGSRPRADRLLIGAHEHTVDHHVALEAGRPGPAEDDGEHDRRAEPSLSTP